jgi:putative membrane protein
MTNTKKLDRLFNVASLVGLLLVFALVFAQMAQARGYRDSHDFVQKAVSGNQFEFESSQLALDRSQDDAVRQFAQQMVDDHKKVADDLQGILPNSNVKPDTIIQTLDAAHMKVLDKLRSVSADSFDKDYIRAQRKAHIETVSLFQNYAKGGDDDALKGFASGTLPVLQQHLQMAKSLHMTDKHAMQ